MSNDCKNCRHYSFYKMINSGPYGYSGVIPCVTCSRYSIMQDNFEAASAQPSIEAACKNLAGKLSEERSDSPNKRGGS